MLVLWLGRQTFGTSTDSAPAAESITGLAWDPRTHGEHL